MKLARDVCACRRVVDEDRTCGHRLEGAVLAQRHAAQVVVVADAAEHELGVLRRLRGRWSMSAAVLGDPFLGFFPRPVVDGDIVPRLREVPGHGVAHDAQSDEGDACHLRDVRVAVVEKGVAQCVTRSNGARSPSGWFSRSSSSARSRSGARWRRVRALPIFPAFPLPSRSCATRTPSRISTPRPSRMLHARSASPTRRSGCGRWRCCGAPPGGAWPSCSARKPSSSIYSCARSGWTAPPRRRYRNCPNAPARCCKPMPTGSTPGHCGNPIAWSRRCLRSS